MSQNPSSRCPDCNAPLEAEGACLACLLGEALEAGGSAVEQGVPDSRFGNFAPQHAGGFGKYTLLRRLGTGGMGVIWEAQEPKLRRLVALKMIRGFVFSTEAEKLRFCTEATAVAQLDHPNIVPIYEVGEVEGQPFFTMKLLDGGSLADRLKQGQLPTREAASILSKLARAVQHAHERGVLHRDLKPGNVLFDNVGEPYLTDFGLAKLVDAEQGLTLSNAQVGTPQYMSPEQARGRARDVTTASDVWALGAMLYQMLTGRLPFPGTTPAEIFSHIAHAEPVSLRTLAASADSDLETLCMRCLEKEPSRRLSSAGELAAELDRWMRGEPIRSRRVTSRARMLRWMRRHPWRVVAGLGLVFSLLAGTIVSLILWQRAEANRRTAEANSKQSDIHAAAERMTGYVSTMAAALAARERHDFSRARQLLTAAPEEHRGFEWRLLNALCAGDQRSLFRLPGGEVPEALAAGPDGTSLAIVTSDGMLHLCDKNGAALRKPRALPPLAGEQDDANQTSQNFHSLLFAPSGKYFALSFRNTIRVFDAETLEVLISQSGIIRVQSTWLDEHRLLCGYDSSLSLSEDIGIWVFDAEKRAAEHVSKDWAAPLVAGGTDRSVVAMTRNAGNEVVLFRTADLKNGGPRPETEPIAKWRHHRGWKGNVLALSADAKFLAALCGPHDDPAHYIEVTELATGRICMELGFREALTGIVFHPTEPQIAVTSTDGVVRLLHFLQPQPEDPGTYDDDCNPTIREPLNGNGAHSPPRRLLTRSAQDGRAVFLLGHEGRGRSLLYTADGGTLFTAAADGTVRCWESRKPQPGTRITNAHVFQLAQHPTASPDGSRLLYSSLKGDVWYWREGRGSIFVSDDHMPLAVLPGTRLATMSRNSSDILLWEENGDTLRQVARIKGPGFVQGFTELLRGIVSADGTKIAGTTPGRIFIVDLNTQSVAATTTDQGWQTSTTRAWDIALSPDARYLIATGHGHQARRYDTADLNKPTPRLGEFRNYDTALAFHPNGRLLYCGNEDGRVRVFETATWTELPGESWQAQSGAVCAIAASNDARLVATTGDTTMKLWLTEKPANAERIQMLSFTTYFPAAWLHFGRDENGGDRSLMHCEPFSSLEIWPTRSTKF